jgi:hypothetical protein
MPNLRAKPWHCQEMALPRSIPDLRKYQHCRVHRTEHGSDHRAIDTLFNIEAQRREQIEPRLLFKNAPWTEISDRVANELQGSPRPQDTQAQTDRLLNIVATAVKALTPTARPSPYAKRWWTQDLTRLRREYTNLRNRARAQRRGGRLNEALEAEAREAAREYHRTLRRQKKGHWEEFLAEESNIWSAARFLQAGKQGAFAKIPPVKAGERLSYRGKGRTGE